MSEYLHDERHLERGDIVHIEINRQANVWLLDGTNYQHYSHGRKFQGYGGHCIASLAKIPVPSTGHWHIVMDLGGHPGTLKYSIKIIKQ